MARNAHGDEIEINVLIKTQGSDTKLVGQMQPYYEALSLQPQRLGVHTIPPLVSQIADGENGGVMMNEFPQAFAQAYRRVASQGNEAGTQALNGSEYLDLLAAAGVRSDDYPRIQAVQQHKLWRLVGSQPTAQGCAAAIAQLQASDPQFSMAGASWTNHLSWVEGYANVLEPMQRLSARFHQRFDPLLAEDPNLTQSPLYQEALLYVLLLETSCFRYWGQGTWTDYARELFRRGDALLAA